MGLAMEMEASQVSLVRLWGVAVWFSQYIFRHNMNIAPKTGSDSRPERNVRTSTDSYI